MKIRVVLVEPEHDGNIGLIARAMKNFGYNDLWLVNPKARLGLEATMMASHARDLLAEAKVVQDLEDALKHCDYAVATTAIVGRSRSNLGRTPLSLREFAERTTGLGGRAAILFGRESKGLTNTEITRCDLVVTIPTSSDYRTLNIAAAVSITLHEFQVARTRESAQFERASKEARERLLDAFEELSGEVRLPAHRIPLVRRALANVISRGLISKREASLMIGVIRRAKDSLRLRKTRRVRRV